MKGQASTFLSIEHFLFEPSHQKQANRIQKSFKKMEIKGLGLRIVV